MHDYFMDFTVSYVLIYVAIMVVQYTYGKNSGHLWKSTMWAQITYILVSSECTVSLLCKLQDTHLNSALMVNIALC